MSRIEDFLAATAPDAEAPLQGSHAADQVFRALLVHLAFSDGVVQQEEFVLLRRVFPGATDTQILSWVMDETDSPMDFHALARVCQSMEERLNCLRFATQMAAMDGVITLDEKIALITVAANLQIDNHQRDTCIQTVADRYGIKVTI